jgi:putative addiction module killer protein
VIEIRETREFSQWLGKLKDRVARGRILARIERLACGLAGDAKPVGQGVSELRIHSGPGYRVYFCQRRQTLIVLLAGGDKATQNRDIETAQRLARGLEQDK